MIIDIYTKDSNVYSFTKANIITSSYISDSAGSEIVIGYTSAAAFNFTLSNLNNQYNNINFNKSKCILYLDDFRTKKLGEFKVDDVKKNKQTIVFSCIDRMVDFDSIFKGATFPISALDLLKQICIQVDIILNNTNILNGDIMLNSPDKITGKTCRDVLKYICEVSGNFAIINNNGELELKWYDLNNIKRNLTYSNLFNYERDEQESEITGVSLYIDNELYIKGLSNYDLYLTNDNPLLSQLSTDDLNLALTNIYNKVNGMKYLGCSISSFFYDDIEVGDVLTITEDDLQVYKIIVSTIKINDFNSFEINSAGENISRTYETNKEITKDKDDGDFTKTIINSDKNLNLMTLNKSNTDYIVNNISIFDVVEKSRCLFTYSAVLYSSLSINIDIIFRLNANEFRVFNLKLIPGQNSFNWAEEINLNIGETNTISVLLRTQDDNIVDIILNKFDSIINIILTDCATDTENKVSNINLRESIHRVIPNIPTIFTNNLIVFKNMSDNLITIKQVPKQTGLIEVIPFLNIPYNNNTLNVNTINENIII